MGLAMKLPLPFWPLFFCLAWLVPARATEGPAAPPITAVLAVPGQSATAAEWLVRIRSVFFVHSVDPVEAERQNAIPLRERSRLAEEMCRTLIGRFPESSERWDAGFELISLRRLSGLMGFEEFGVAETDKAYEDLLAIPALPDDKRRAAIEKRLHHEIGDKRTTPESVRRVTGFLEDAVDRYGADPFDSVLRAASRKPGYLTAFLASVHERLKIAAARHQEVPTEKAS